MRLLLGQRKTINCPRSSIVVPPSSLQQGQSAETTWSRRFCHFCSLEINRHSESPDLLDLGLSCKLAAVSGFFVDLQASRGVEDCRRGPCLSERRSSENRSLFQPDIWKSPYGAGIEAGRREAVLFIGLAA